MGEGGVLKTQIIFDALFLNFLNIPIAQFKPITKLGKKSMKEAETNWEILYNDLGLIVDQKPP